MDLLDDIDFALNRQRAKIGELLRDQPSSTDPWPRWMSICESLNMVQLEARDVKGSCPPRSQSEDREQNSVPFFAYFSEGWQLPPTIMLVLGKTLTKRGPPPFPRPIA